MDSHWTAKHECENGRWWMVVRFLGVPLSWRPASTPPERAIEFVKEDDNFTPLERALMAALEEATRPVSE